MAGHLLQMISPLQPYFSKQNELSITDGWGNRVVIPAAGCQQILEELHESHQGASRMKGRVEWLCGGPTLIDILNS